MGYYSQLEWNLEVPADKLEELKSAIAEMEQKIKKDNFRSEKERKKTENLFFYWLVDLQFEPVDDKYLLTYEEYYQKHYYDELFVEFIWPYIAKPAEMILRGEDGITWGYYFGLDGIYELEFIKKRGRKIYDYKYGRTR